MFVDGIVAFFPAIKLDVTKVAFTVVGCISFGLVEEACARELFHTVSALCRENDR
jgi:hypothetical protein